MSFIIYGHEREKYHSLMKKVFELRYRLFVEERKWALPSHDGLEIDQYDTDEAVYFVSLTDDGAIESSVRMTPTMKSSLLADYFPHLVETGEDPRSPNVFEATRYIVRPAGKSGRALRQAKGRLFIPVIEWCLERKLTDFQCIIDARALASYLEMGPQTRILGLAHPFGGGRGVAGGGECLAVRWPINERGLEEVRAYVEDAGEPLDDETAREDAVIN